MDKAASAADGQMHESCGALQVSSIGATVSPVTLDIEMEPEDQPYIERFPA